MRALLSTAPGGPETLELTESPDPVPAKGQVLVAVKACAINYPDVLIIEDNINSSRSAPSHPVVRSPVSSRRWARALPTGRSAIA